MFGIKIKENDLAEREKGLVKREEDLKNQEEHAIRDMQYEFARIEQDRRKGIEGTKKKLRNLLASLKKYALCDSSSNVINASLIQRTSES